MSATNFWLHNVFTAIFQVLKLGLVTKAKYIMNEELIQIFNFLTQGFGSNIAQGYFYNKKYMPPDQR